LVLKILRIQRLVCLINTHRCGMRMILKVLMQGKLIAVAYTLRTYWDQFSLGANRIDAFLQYPRRLKTFNFDNFGNSHNSFLWPDYFIDYFCENGLHVRLWHPSCVYFFHPKTVHCSIKNSHTSKIIFLALVPWIIKSIIKNNPPKKLFLTQQMYGISRKNIKI